MLPVVAAIVTPNKVFIYERSVGQQSRVFAQFSIRLILTVYISRGAAPGELMNERGQDMTQQLYFVGHIIRIEEIRYRNRIDKVKLGVQ